MFVTILTIIYSAIAIFIIGRFIKKRASRLTKWRKSLAYKYKSSVNDKKEHEQYPTMRVHN